MKDWNSSKRPIFTANQMPAPVKWNPMSEDWKAWLGENQVYHGTSGFSKEVLETMKKLHDHILTFGGDEVCMTTYDEDAQKILDRGQFFYGSSYMRKGEPCHCNGLCSLRRWALALSFVGRSAYATHPTRVGNHRQARRIFWRSSD